MRMLLRNFRVNQNIKKRRILMLSLCVFRRSETLQIKYKTAPKTVISVIFRIFILCVIISLLNVFCKKPKLLTCRWSQISEHCHIECYLETEL